ncbi:hypothetical protein FRC03_001616 [Tulasnella sp. 419]|nr:hypothetical protein FRC02_007524 [Tulasnella sp. 418]KAG8964586.1 hypothetical protein FRC03_001616 [Tulasnella sp. 419]
MSSKHRTPSSGSSDFALRRPSPSHTRKGKEPDHSSVTSSTRPSSGNARFNEEEIRRRLAILASIARPLSPTLPPSPPLSPRPLKRKAPSDDSLDAAKKSRTATLPKPNQSLHHDSSSGSSSTRRASPLPVKAKEDGELDDVPVPGPSSIIPIQPLPQPLKPRRRLTREQLNSMSASYMAQARTFKRSGDKRVDLHNMPPPSHRNYALRLLEHTDSILHFVYSFWCEDEARGTYGGDSWSTLEGFLSSTLSGWDKVITASDPDLAPSIKVITGLLHLIRFCAIYRVNRREIRKLRTDTHPSVAPSPAGGHNSASPSNTVTSSQPTPPYPSTTASNLIQHQQQNPIHAPSPASSSSSSTGHHLSSNLKDSHHRHANSQSPSHLAASQVLVPPTFISRVHKTVSATYELHNAQAKANHYLALHNVGRYFPTTHAVCIGNNAATGKPLISGVLDDAIQVNMEECGQGKGEWAWPVLTGDDVVHAVGFGRSLLWEIGPKFGGYLGENGLNKDDRGKIL